MSRASQAAAERRAQAEQFVRAPTIDPAVGINRAKLDTDNPVPTAPTDINNPGATADVNGQHREGQDSPDAVASGVAAVPTPSATPLPGTLTPAAVVALTGAGIYTLEESAALSDAQLDTIKGVGDSTITALRDAARTAGLTWPDMPPQGEG